MKQKIAAITAIALATVLIIVSIVFLVGGHSIPVIQPFLIAAVMGMLLLINYWNIKANPSLKKALFPIVIVYALVLLINVVLAIIQIIGLYH